jgi:Amt family ammonium transporter
MKKQWHDNMSLRIKATVVVLTATLLALSVMTITGIVQMRSLIAAEEVRTVDAIAQGIGHASELALAVGDRRELSRLAEGFLRNDQILFVVFYDSKGRLIVHASQNEEAWNSYAETGDSEDFILGKQNIEVSAAAIELSQETVEGVSTGGQSSAATRTPKHVGSVVVALSTAPAHLAQQQQGRLTAASTMAAMTLGVVIVFLGVTGWTRRLKKLVDASERISEGNFTESIQDQRNDEIGRLTHAYERMREAVRQRDNELRQFNETLVQQVADRTRSLEVALRAAESADKAKSLFLANMSHEIRTPLNGVVGMIDLLRGTPLDESQSRFAQVARSSADALLSVINDILDFSKIEAGHMELESVGFDLTNVVENVAETASVSAARKGLDVNCLIHPNVPENVIGDSTRIGQVLLNLTNNAIKFTEKGQVVIDASLVEQDETHAIVKFKVTDSGIGIPDDRRNRLFQSFSQVDASTTRKYGGSGLGLAISKRLVEIMGGEIGVESQVGSGSTFWFTIRIQKSQAPTKLQQNVVSSLESVKVLGVDDNAVNREILEQQLRAWNMEIVTAADGPNAIQILRQAKRDGRPFKLAILDWHMPGMDGIELANAIRAMDEISDIPLVMLTSVEDRIAAPELKTIGFAGHLVKPVRQSRLLDTIAEAIGKGALKPANTGPASTTSDRAAALPQTPSMRAHLLLAEDNEINQIVASEILKNAGYSYDIVGAGTDAVDAVCSKHYDLVLMDCQMPGMDGFEATRAIRDREANGAMCGSSSGRIPIVALTANAIKGDREVCLASGMDDYVTKPINPVKLIEVIERHLPEGVGGKPKADSLTDWGAGHSAEPERAPLDMPSLLERCLGSSDLANKVLRLFSDQVGKEVSRLEHNLQEGNLENFCRVAHTVKGCAANVSAEPVRAIAAELEQLARAGNVTDANEKLLALNSEVQRCIQYIAAAQKPNADSANKTAQTN